jgi:hypothetical protein
MAIPKAPNPNGILAKTVFPGLAIIETVPEKLFAT